MLRRSVSRGVAPNDSMPNGGDAPEEMALESAPSPLGPIRNGIGDESGVLVYAVDDPRLA